MYISNLISYFIGKLSELPLPKFIWQIIIKLFIRLYGVNTSEIKRPLDNFANFQEFFCRELKEGARPIQNSLTCPADCHLRDVQTINGDFLTQVKNKQYSVSKLLGSTDNTAELQNGLAYNFYLSPKDYHRVHAPMSGQITKIKRIPGYLFPVNNWGLHKIDELFSRNERLIIEITNASTRVYVVLVGAFNVGKITLSDICHQQEIEAGQELAQFKLGSSVVLLLNENACQQYLATDTLPSAAMQMGQSLSK